MNNYKKEFNKINPSDKEIKNIYEKIIIKKQNKSIIILRKSLVYILAILVITSLISATYAKDINKIIDKIKIKYIPVEDSKHEGLEKIQVDYPSTVFNQNADFPEKEGVSFYDYKDGNYKTYTYDEINKMLDVKILKNDYFKNDYLIHETGIKKDNKLTFVSFQDRNAIEPIPDKYDKKGNPIYKEYVSVDYRLALMSQEYLDSLPEELKNSKIGYTGVEGAYSEEYKIKSLDTKALMLYSHEDKHGFVRIYFSYKGIAYSLRISISKTYIDNHESFIYDLLESFHE